MFSLYFDLGDEKEQNELRAEYQKALNDFLTYSDPDFLNAYSNARVKVRYNSCVIESIKIINLLYQCYLFHRIF